MFGVAERVEGKRRDTFIYRIGPYFYNKERFYKSNLHLTCASPKREGCFARGAIQS